ncbi:hypothetical protein Y032_0039g46 [Ancylostoma ceylanicum]|uniref:Uncharacterized protein n=1 Tax=Ancylostoma ceylanicum TaxID=53326 RepID=A0A016UJZ8_9BILA|nr:hypothetical protein Y032_0039g46 [Ancylostoma ceylanicum]
MARCHHNFGPPCIAPDIAIAVATSFLICIDCGRSSRRYRTAHNQYVSKMKSPIRGAILIDEYTGSLSGTRLRPCDGRTFFSLRPSCHVDRSS